jgi:hypothetical protein
MTHSLRATIALEAVQAVELAFCTQVAWEMFLKMSRRALVSAHLKHAPLSASLSMSIWLGLWSSLSPSPPVSIVSTRFL